MRDIKCSPEAREKCPFDHPCDSEEKAYFEEGSPCDEFNKALIPSPPPTNADHIRAMSDEELAKILLDGCRGSKCDDQPQNEWGSVNCFQCRMDWLKQPYKEAPNDPT